MPFLGDNMFTFAIWGGAGLAAIQRKAQGTQRHIYFNKPRADASREAQSLRATRLRVGRRFEHDRYPAISASRAHQPRLQPG